jgi:hypothetical protein
MTLSVSALPSRSMTTSVTITPTATQTCYVITIAGGGGGLGFKGTGSTEFQYPRGTGSFGVDGAGSSVLFNGPRGIAISDDALATSIAIFVADELNNKVRVVSLNGDTATLAGSLSAGFVDGQGTNAMFFQPSGVVAAGPAAAFTVWVTDMLNNAVRVIDASGFVSTLCGNGPDAAGTDDGFGTNARFDGPMALARKSDGSLIVADTNRGLLRAVSPAGLVSTIRPLDNPSAVAFDVISNRVIVASNELLYAIDSSGAATVIAGRGSRAFASQQGTSSGFTPPLND